MDFWTILGGFVGVAAGLLAVSSLLGSVIVYDYQAAVRFARGRVAAVLPPGWHWYVRPASRVVLLDARPRVVTIPAQEILTRDNVSVKLSLLATFQLKDARAAILNAESFEQTLYAELQNALRVFVTSLAVDELVARRAEIGDAVREAARPTAAGLGLELQAVNVKDVMFPGSLRDAFAAVTKARQDGLAALERARGEAAAVRSLANTARVVETNPYLFELRLLQSVAESKAGTLVVNVPPAPEARRPAAEPEPS